MHGVTTSVQSQVVYVSEAVADFDDERIERLANLAAAKNHSLDVTGYLFFAKERFIQYLEGAPGVVRELLDTIQRDDRHEILATAWRHTETERRFPRWSMRWVRGTEVTEVGLEQLLADQVLLNSRVNLVTLGLDQSIWRIVDSISSSIYSRHTVH